MLDAERGEPGSQISVLRDGGALAAVLLPLTPRSATWLAISMCCRWGMDLAPALDANAFSSTELIAATFNECLQHHGQARIPKAAMQAIRAVANVLNIAWVEEALEQPARIICPRSGRCPRPGRCEGAPAVSRPRDHRCAR